MSERDEPRSDQRFNLRIGRGPFGVDVLGIDSSFR